MSLVSPVKERILIFVDIDSTQRREKPSFITSDPTPGSQAGHGRFSSPDPLSSSATTANPKSWNRYVYVENNPLTYSDPSGTDLWINYQGVKVQIVANKDNKTYSAKTEDGKTYEGKEMAYIVKGINTLADKGGAGSAVWSAVNLTGYNEVNIGTTVDPSELPSGGTTADVTNNRNTTSGLILNMSGGDMDNENLIVLGTALSNAAFLWQNQSLAADGTLIPSYAQFSTGAKGEAQWEDQNGTTTRTPLERNGQAAAAKIRENLTGVAAPKPDQPQGSGSASLHANG